MIQAIFMARNTNADHFVTARDESGRFDFSVFQRLVVVNDALCMRVAVHERRVCAVTWRIRARLCHRASGASAVANVGLWEACVTRTGSTDGAIAAGGRSCRLLLRNCTLE
jgi:hypothetical protein